MNPKVTLEMLNEVGELWRDAALCQTEEVRFVAPRVPLRRMTPPLRDPTGGGQHDTFVLHLQKQQARIRKHCNMEASSDLESRHTR